MCRSMHSGEKSRDNDNVDNNDKPKQTIQIGEFVEIFFWTGNIFLHSV